MLDGLGKEQMYNVKILTRKSEAYLSYCTANSLLLNFYNFASLECEKMEFQGNLFCISLLLRVLSYVKKRAVSVHIIFLFNGCWLFSFNV